MNGIAKKSIRKKRIAMVLFDKPEGGGVYQYEHLVINSLEKLENQEVSICFFATNNEWKQWCRKKGYECYGIILPDRNLSQYKAIEKIGIIIPTFIKWYNKKHTEFGKQIEKRSIDLVIYPIQECFAFQGVKTISTVHDLMHRYESGFPEVQVNFEEREQTLHIMNATTDAVLTDSKMGKNQYKELYFKKGNNNPMVFPLPFTTINNRIVGKLDSGKQIPNKFIFYPAQFWKHKNHINLLKAICILKNEIPDINLILVGTEKNNKKEICKYIVQHELENNVSILGFVSDEMIVFLYEHAIGMIMPSYFGPTNIPPLEAMNLGCPVAVSDNYAMPQQVGKAGLTFAPDSPEEIADCIRKMWLDEN